MRVVCERCNAEYTIDDKRVPATGLKIKCPKCMHTFEVRKGQEPASPPPEPGPLAVETATFHAPDGPEPGPAAEQSFQANAGGPPPGPADLDLDLDLPVPESAGNEAAGVGGSGAGEPVNIDEFDLDVPAPSQGMPEPSVQAGAGSVGPEPGPTVVPAFDATAEPESVDEAFADIFDEAVGAAPKAETGEPAEASASPSPPRADEEKVVQEGNHVDLFSTGSDAAAGLDEFLGDIDAGMEVVDYDEAQSDEVHYRIRRDGDKVFGPYSADAIKRMIREQKLKGNEEVSTDEVNWIPLGSAGEFAPVLLEMVRKGAGEVLKDKEGSKREKGKKKKAKKRVLSARKSSLMGRLLTAAGLLAATAVVAYLALFTDLLKFGRQDQDLVDFEKQIKAAHQDVENRTPDSLESAIKRIDRIRDRLDDDLLLQGMSLKLFALSEKILAGMDPKKSAEEAEAIYQDLKTHEPDFPLYFKALALYLTAKDDYTEARQAVEMAISRNNNDKETHLVKARLFLRAGDMERASEALAAASKLAPDDTDVLCVQGELALLSGKIDEAGKAFAAALAAKPDHVPSLLGNAKVLLKKGRPKEALQLLEKIIGPLKRNALPVDLAESMDLAGEIYFQARRYKKAAAVLKEAVSLSKQTVDYHVHYGNVLLELNQPAAAMAEFKAAAKLKPKSVEAVIGMARALLESGEAVQANLKLNDARSFAEKDARLHYWLGKASEALVQEDKAIISYKTSITLDPHYLEPYVALARLYLKRNEGESAKKVLEKVKSFARESPEAHNSFGEVYNWEKNYDKAEQAFRKALEVEPDFLEARLNLANVLRDTGRYKEAEKEYREVFSRDPRYGVAHYHFGRSLQMQEKYAEAVNEYRMAVELGYKNAASLSAMGSAYYMKGDLADAEKVLLSALDEDSKSVKAHFYLGRVYLDQKDVEKAVYHFREALAWDPKNCDVHFWLGVAWERKDSPRDAIDQFDETTRLCPSHIDAYLHLGAMYRSENAIRQAIKYYRKALQLDSTRADVLVQIGQSFELLDDLKNAIKFYRKALKINGEECSAWKALAKVYVTMEKGREAIRAFKKAIENCPDDPTPYRFLGYLYKDKNRLKIAKQMFEKYIELSPNADDLGQIKEEIEYLKQDLQ